MIKGGEKMGVYKYGGYGVDVKLISYSNPSDVFWSEKCNSYVIVEPRDPDRALFTHPEHGPVNLISINGMGEIRWDTLPWDVDKPEQKAAMEFFGLSLKEK